MNPKISPVSLSDILKDKKLCLFSLLTVCLFSRIIFGQNTNNSEKSVALELNKTVERKVKDGRESHGYQITLAANQYAKIVVEQTEVDVSIKLSGADGSPVTTQNNEIRLKENEVFEFVAVGNAGEYLLEIQPTTKDGSGIYKIRLEEAHEATARENALFEARTAVETAEDLLKSQKYEAALPVAVRALEIAEKELKADDPFVGRTLTTLGFVQLRRGNYSVALSLLQRAVTVNEKSLGAEHQQTLDALFDLGLYYRFTNDFVKAGQIHRQILEIQERILGKDHKLVANILNSLGNLFNSLGDNARAESYLLRAMAITEKRLGAEDFQMGLIVNNLGVVCLDIKNYERAAEYFERALKIYEKTIGTENSIYSNALQNLGIIYRNRKDYEKALELYERALVIREKALGKEHQDIGFLLNNIANIYKAKGDYSKALEIQRRVREIAEKSVGQYHTLTIISLGNTATIYAAQGDAANAVASLKLYDERFEKVVALNLTIGSERQKLAYTAVFPSRTSRTISLHTNLARDNQTAIDQAALVVLQRKGRVLDAVSANLTALRQRASAADLALLDRLNTVTTQLAKLTLSKPAKMSAEEYRKQIADLESEKEKLEIEINERSPQFGIGTPPVTLAAVKAEIPTDAALIEFAVYRPFDPKAENNDEAYAAPRYISYVLRKNGEVKWTELGDKKTIDQSIDDLRKALRDAKRNDVKQLARTAEAKIMQPVRELLGDDVKQIFISPDGDLNLIPFESLVDEKGKYLIERYSFDYLTGGRDLLRMKRTQISQNEILIVANPAFGTGGAAAKTTGITATRNLSDTYFTPLAGTMTEARSIQNLFPDAIVYSEGRASETALKEINAPRILHIATHGFFLQNTDEINPAQNSSNRNSNANAESENPLLRSGIALADANKRDAGAKDDGILTALEASGLNLQGTKLVVLSACDTGIGEVKNGEGVYGLRRAFVLAGTETLMMSLWQVSDYATRELMTNYYKNLKQGMGRGASLRQVQLEMISKKEFKHPFYWAAFIQSGEWANLDGKR